MKPAARGGCNRLHTKKEIGESNELTCRPHSMSFTLPYPIRLSIVSVPAYACVQRSSWTSRAKRTQERRHIEEVEVAVVGEIRTRILIRKRRQERRHIKEIEIPIPVHIRSTA